MAVATQKTAVKRTVKTAAKAADDIVATATAASEDAFKSAEDYTKAAQEHFETFVKTFSGNAEDFREQAEEFATEMRACFEQTQKRVADINADLVEAARTETADAVQFASDLTKVKSFADALELHRDYWTKLFETRMERARDLTEVSVETVRVHMEPASGFASMFDATKYTAFFQPKA